MNHETFFENLELLTDAPNGVQKLREMILSLAVQGKLVPQDSGDEPAAVLLEKIKVIKERLAKEGKFRKSNFLPPIRENEKYFKLPTGWQWVRFDDICSYIQRGKGPKYVEKSDIPVVSQKCIQWDGFKLDRARFISPSTLEKYNEERFLITGDLLWNSTGTGTIGRVNVYVHEDNSYDKIVADSHVTVIRPILMNSRFFYCWVASPIIQNEIEEMASGTTNQIELNLSTIKNHLVPLPPFDEQKRIVTKVDQLMALCDELEARQQKKHEQRILLNNAALDKLLTAPTPEEFAQHWQRICDNFDLLYDAPETVGLLRQAILQLAVKGKLVVQDPRDEPAINMWDLGKTITNEKDFPILPKNWVCRRLKEISKRVSVGHVGSTSKYYCDKENGIPFIRSQNVRPADFNFKGLRYITQEFHNSLKKSQLQPGDLLFVRVGANRGDCCLVPQDVGELNCANIVFARPYDGVSDYLQLFCQSPLARNLLLNMTTGSAQGVINTKSVAELPIPLPPFEEQKRIVAKVDQLMALCDELEAGLVQAQTDGEKLMEAVVHHVLAG